LEAKEPLDFSDGGIDETGILFGCSCAVPVLQGGISIDCRASRPRQALIAALNLAGFVTGTFLQQSPPSKEIVFVNTGLTYRF
jgi:hypothetical protein